MNDSLGDKLKAFENKDRFDLNQPVIARLDGKNFHKYTKDFDRPFYPALSAHFANVTKQLANNTNANLAYTQSDEITLVWMGRNTPFDGRKDKLTSVLASMLTGEFNFFAPWHDSDGYEIANFDCRVYNVPDSITAIEVFKWRQQDAIKNSVSMAARSVFSHRQLLGRSTREMRIMLKQERDIDWDEYPSYFRLGTFIQRYKIVRAFTELERSFLAPKHEAHTNPNLMVERNQLRHFNVHLSSVHNQIGFVFGGEEPIIGSAPYPICVAGGCSVHPYVL